MIPLRVLYSDDQGLYVYESAFFEEEHQMDICQECHRVGHTTKDCPEFEKRDRKRKKNK